MEKLCDNCDNREHCQTPCKEVNAILWENNHVMEKHYSDAIVVFPGSGKERHFSELTDKQLDEISEVDVIPWSSGDTNLRKTAVFIERFFNKVPCKELAERFRVKENTIVCMYKNAIDEMERIITVLDARKEGIKALKPGKFTEDQKFFLLSHVFGFSQEEVARMFKQDRNRVNMKVKRMADKYEALFSGQNISPIGEKEEIPIDDPPIPAKLTRADISTMVENYIDQGLSHRQAFKRIADRYGEVVGRKVSPRGIESRYYKAMKKPVKSVYDGLSKNEIVKRMTGQ